MKWLFIFAAGAVLASCNSSIEFRKRVLEDLYEIELEKSMVNLSGNDSTASLKYGNRYKQLYFTISYFDKEEFKEENILIHMSDEELLDYYMEILQTTEFNHLNSAAWIGNDVREINNMPAAIYHVNLNANGHSFHHKIACVIADRNVYILRVWVIEERFERFAEGMERMINSFREL